MPRKLSEWGLSLVRWFDSHAGGNAAIGGDPYRVDLLRSIPFFVLHVACLGVIWLGWSPVAVATAVVLYLARMFFITGFYHRYFSHRSFKTSRAGQLVMAVLGATCVQKGALWWAAHHRHHHRHSDEEQDFHSPNQHGFYWSHIGWITARNSFPTRLEAVPDLAKYPELVFLNRFDTLVPVALLTLLGLVGGYLGRAYPELGTNGPQMILWGFCISTVVLFHASCTINSLAHRLGRKRYATGDESGNSFPLAVLTFGEGWHNNHHHYPGAAAQGFYWWEVDLTLYLLRALSWAGLIWDLQPVPDSIRSRRLPTPASS